MDASHVYVRALALGCFYSHISTQTFQRTLRGDKECRFSGVTKYGRVWRKVPESGARSVYCALAFWSDVVAAELFHFQSSVAERLCVKTLEAV